MKEDKKKNKETEDVTPEEDVVDESITEAEMRTIDTTIPEEETEKQEKETNIIIQIRGKTVRQDQIADIHTSQWNPSN